MQPPKKFFSFVFFHLFLQLLLFCVFKKKTKKRVIQKEMTALSTSSTSIRHLVFSGGGHSIFATWGALQTMEKAGIYQPSNIKSIFGTSAGGIVGTLCCLGFDWETINDYLIHRPWQDVFTLNVGRILEAYTQRGLFPFSTFESIFKPLFLAKDFNLELTLQELFEFSKIDLHLYSLELNEFKVHDLSHTTHPDLPVIKAIQMTCALPLIFSPHCVNETKQCFVDGGIFVNYPLTQCLDSKANPEEILSFHNAFEKGGNNITQEIVNTESSLIDFIFLLMFKVLQFISTDCKQPHIPNEVKIVKSQTFSISVLQKVCNSPEVRKELLEFGVMSANKFLHERTQERQQEPPKGT
jgi:predicted acylesterase/phospholipase RssA